MADGKWVMTEDDEKRVDLTFRASDRKNIRELPNYGRTEYADDRDGKALRRCAFCGSDDLQTGFGGFGEGFGYSLYKCRACGGSTGFVYKDETGRFFK
jgi:hypothetical protein